MRSRTIQYILIILVISAIAGSFFYFKGKAAMTVNKAGLTSVKINSSQANQLTSGLVGYWTFDGPDTNWTSATAGTTADKSPVGTNTGTLTNMSRSTSPVIGKVGQALNFDGSNDYVNAGGSPGLALLGSMTISAWIKPNASDGEYMIMAKHGYWGTPYEFKIAFGKLSNFSGDWDGSCMNATTSSDSINLNQWQHVVFVRNTSDQITFYVNGVQDSGGWQASSCVVDDGAEALIGSDGEYYVFSGYLDEVRIYNRALSAGEITELYNLGR